ncbi:hypothetical protein [Paraburkholderia humisilvae]|uniref:Uncharacterized protein n=1 Tax=Paraburkholderia humisilvae TaxID=627669 RepID=A0A6J5E5X7_9BURK|nr:hypothetical protein [Paraburkholderia humisilvae]CAB3760706.1 hypothetical protein LMG29542_03901 [Paraburkholderia humisilvae]
MRIAGRQYFENLRNVLVAKKQLQDKGSKPGADDGVVTTQDIRKGTLFGVLWPDSQSGQTAGQTTSHASRHTSGHKPVQPASPSPADNGTSKPSDSQIDIYV